jgi:GDP-mannose pyrophosphatase NudK
MNQRIRIEKEEVLSDNWYILKKITFDYRKKNGDWIKQEREAYDRGNGATILLYNKEQQTVILTKQFRLPTYVNGNGDGMLIESCAGLLDNDSPEVAIRRETEEETGFIIDNVEKVFEAYMSPGSVTEKLFFYIAEYSRKTQRNEGGGIEEEEIEVLELTLEQAMAMVKSGEIMDGKTIILLQHLIINNVLQSCTAN